MHRPLTAAAVATALGAGVLAAGPAAVAQSPTRPWATVNVCDPAGGRGQVGVRVFVPVRGARRTQWIRVRLQFFDANRRVWRDVTGGTDRTFTRIGRGVRAVMGGTTFQVDPPARGSRLLLRGIAAVQWRSGTRVVARATVRTTSGHRNASDPQLRVSRANCRIAR
jgi:hypothetical protein